MPIGAESEGQAPRSFWRRVAVSATLHLLALLVLGLLPTKKLQAPPAEQSISLEILTEAPTEMPATPAIEGRIKPPSERATAKNIESTASSRSSVSGPAGGGMVRAKELFSASVLADPRSRGALAALRQLAADDRIIQLCNVEAMEQVHRWNGDYHPDFVVAYAKTDAKVSGLTLQVEGGALRSDQRWYDTKFKCQVTPDLETVVAFEFALGAEIPASEWGMYSLPAATAQPTE